MTQVERTSDLATCLDLRHRVFVAEQGVPEALERDALDATALHFLAFTGDTPIGTARVVVVQDTAKIGRVCVLPQARGTGLGAALIRAAMDHAHSLPGVAQAKLGAQTLAIGFYEKLGFAAVGAVYQDAGIPHQDMVCPL